MKHILLWSIAVVVMYGIGCFEPCYSQALENDCGTWKPDSIVVTQWQSIDTLKKHVTTNKRNWVESHIQDDGSWQANSTPAVYCPCGCGFPYKQLQYRVCSITGIRQIRYFIHSFHYIPKPKTEYQLTLDSLKR